MRVWAELSNLKPSKVRYDALVERMNKEGIASEVRYITEQTENFGSAVAQAQAEGVEFFRLGGRFCEETEGVFTNFPSKLLTIRSADALIPDAQKKLWPRNFLVEAIERLLASEKVDLDLSGSAFINGLGPDSRAAVAALARTGFSRFNISDLDEKRGLQYLEDFRRAYFNVQFQFTHRPAVTQLAGTHSIAVNTITLDEDPHGLNELFYFNFLKAHGVWLEIPLGPQTHPLIQEAKSVGAQVESSARLASLHDSIWVESCFGKVIDDTALCHEYTELFDSRSAPIAGLGAPGPSSDEN